MDIVPDGALLMWGKWPSQVYTTLTPQLQQSRSRCEHHRSVLRPHGYTVGGIVWATNGCHLLLFNGVPPHIRNDPSGSYFTTQVQHTHPGGLTCLLRLLLKHWLNRFCSRFCS